MLGSTRIALRLVLICLCLSGCSRLAKDGFVFQLDRPEQVTLSLREAGGDRVLRMLDRELLAAGKHRAECVAGKFVLDGKERGDVPHGTWQWGAYGHVALTPKLRGAVCQQGTPAGRWPAASGAPSAVVADGETVYMGRSAGTDSGCVAALDAAEQLRWSHQRAQFGVQALGVDAGELFVLADQPGVGGGSVIYKLAVASGQPVPWAGREERDLWIDGLWEAKGKYPRADAMTVGNGRIYLSFTEAGFMAVLDAKDGHYVTTVSGPQPAQLAVSLTPIRDAEGQQQIGDFGVVVLAKSALSFFVMPHDSPWVAANTTHWLAADEKITAFTMRAETMSTGEVQLYTALGPPHSQVQMLLAADPSGFVLTAGRSGGRATTLGAWDASALRVVRSLALDAGGKLWVAEGDASPPRFSRWTTSGKESKLEREFFVPVGPAARGAALDPMLPGGLIAAGCEWALDLKTGHAKCLGIISEQEMQAASFVSIKGRHLLAARQGAAWRFYERVAPGKWRVLAQLRVAPGEAATYWADANGDGEQQAEETLLVPVKSLPSAVNAGGGLVVGDSQYAISGWSAAGAPLYDWQPAKHVAASNELREVLAAALPAQALWRYPDGRAFYLETGDGAFSVYEVEGAETLRQLGTGQWQVD